MKSRKDAMQITVPFVEGELFMALHSEMISLDEGDEHVGALSTGSGLGNDCINLEWRGKRIVIFGRELLRAWVETFDPEGAKRIPK